MPTHEFTLLLAGTTDTTEEFMAMLKKLSCPDACVRHEDDTTTVHFHREADSLRDAITSAIRDVRRTGLNVARVETEEALLVAELNVELLGVPACSEIQASHILLTLQGTKSQIRRPIKKDPFDNWAGRTTHYAEMRKCDSEDNLGREWNYYVDHVGQWLEDGHEGKHVLLKGEEVIGFFETGGEAEDKGCDLYPGQPIFVKKVLTQEPLLRIRGISF